MSKNCIQLNVPDVSLNEDMPLVGGWTLDAISENNVVFAKACAPIKVIPSAGVTVNGSSDPIIITPNSSKNINFQIIGTGTVTVVDGYFSLMDGDTVNGSGLKPVLTHGRKYYCENLQCDYLKNANGKKTWDTFAILDGTCKSVYCSYLTDRVDGDVSILQKINSIESITVLRIWNSHVYGDLAKIMPNGGTFGALIGNSTYENEFVWSSRTASCGLLVLRYIDLGNSVDDYLIESAQNNPSVVLASSFASKDITINGTRTSASDSAVATLKAAGIGVRVNGEDL